MKTKKRPRGSVNLSAANDRPIDRIIAKLHNVRPDRKGWRASCPCPNHGRGRGDRNPSLSLSVGDGDRVLLRCHAGCSTADVLTALGLTSADLFPTTPEPAPKCKDNGAVKRVYETPGEAIDVYARQLGGPPSRTWTYRNAEGEAVGIVARWDGEDEKEIRPISRSAKGWYLGAMPPPRPLLNLGALADADTIYIVEGEACADAAASIGLVATTWAGGTNAVHFTDWTPLAGKSVVILPDNDAPGRKAAQRIAEILTRRDPPAIVRIVELPDLPEGGDLADWLAADGPMECAEPEACRARIEQLAAETPVYMPTSGTVEVPAPCEAPGWTPFPTDALPDVVRAFVEETADAMGCDAAQLAVPALVAMAGAIGGSRAVRLKMGWLEPSALWAVVVAESGTLKSPALEKAAAPLYGVQAAHFDAYREVLEQFRAEQQAYEAELADWKRQGRKEGARQPELPTPPVCVRYVVSDTTTEALVPILVDNPRGVTLVRDELSAWLGAMDRYARGGRSADVAAWLELHRAGTVTVDRKTGVPRTLHVRGVAVSIVGTITPDALRRQLDAENWENGLGPRFLFACPPDRSRRWSDREPRDETLAAYDRLIRDLCALSMREDENGCLRPYVLTLAPDAEAEWVAFYNRHAERMEREHGPYRAILSKLEGGAARLALVIHVANEVAAGRDATAPVSAEAMRAGVTLAEWFANEAARLLALRNESPEQRERRELIDYIEARRDRHGGRAGA